MNNFGLKSITYNKEKLKFIPSYLLNFLEFERGLDDFTPEFPDKYYLYTGRGPSYSSFHIGHIMSLILILEFQKYLKNKIYFMISDDEKIFRDNIMTEKMELNVQKTIKQLNKIGFNDDNTYIHINSKGISEDNYKLIIKLTNTCTINELSKIFGTKKYIGEYFYVFYQLMPCFINPNKQCIVIAGIDQEPFFRLARDIAEKIKYPKPIILYTKNIPGLDGSIKMSTSNLLSNPIFIDDTLETIKYKIMSIKQVGAGTLNELFEFGSNLDKDIPFKIIDIFDTNRHNVDLIKKGYTSGVITDSLEHINLKLIMSEKGIQTRENKTMVTSYGIRIYLINLINGIVSFINIPNSIY